MPGPGSWKQAASLKAPRTFGFKCCNGMEKCSLRLGQPRSTTLPHAILSSEDDTSEVPPGEDLIESFISRVEAWSSNAAKRKALVVVGGNVLPEWLLKKAVGPPSPDQAAAENAICNLLSDGASSSVLES